MATAATEYPDAFPDLNLVDVLRIEISDELHKITGVAKKDIYDSLQWTAGLGHGDLNLAVPRLRIKGTAPKDLAEKWTKEASLFKPAPHVSEPTSEGVFVRFRFNPETLPSLVIPQVLKLKDKYGFNPAFGLKDRNNPSLGRQKVIIEYSSPNIAKTFHVGHLRSTIIGGFLSNLFERTGYDVVRMNYLGDWGRQYGLLAIGWKKYGNEELFAADPTGHLFDVYVKISADFKPEEDRYKEAAKKGEDTAELEQQGLLGEAKRYFKRMEDGDEEALTLWRRFRNLSIEKYKSTYSRLNIHFDEYSGESQVKQDSMDKAERILKENGVTEYNKGATIVDFKKYGKNVKHLETAIIRNRNGTSNYLLRDVGAAMQRADTYHFDKMYYVVMSEQDAHLQRLFQILKLMGPPYDDIGSKCQHITFGKIMGMSTRRGTVKFLDDILADIGEHMHEVMKKNETTYARVAEPEKTADILGISSIMVQDMVSLFTVHDIHANRMRLGKKINNYDFRLERMTSFEGDTGPYLQYAHARLCSIAGKAGIPVEELQNADLTLLKETHAIDLIRLMAQYPDMVIQTYKTLEPTTILRYLFQLTHELSSGYDSLRVVNAPGGPTVSLARAAMYEAAREVLHSGMTLLGLTPVTRM